ncbi:hypothetical protein Htur_3356 [Haloterrigena turkmenica DSM 5511]|uniref:Uncharacterized protein n=1 Tax=Haloterrigena turkmenica (strain ATCC 51198 / DSM 5511 / JCM 9101 / NCIMB 13204 / VKM B-1734 / 4k) TaxID=543526 RepID=D2RPR8_HALTV|nr:hypothetical protein [Haloterrigena turkmenica]ADB62220.1 hypothetical protein Htur_3356 [Haloterrigena turkmenica DSM 5511]
MMSGAVILVFLLFAIAIPLLLWIAIESETSDPTVVDRAEAERIATERGGRGTSGADSSDDPATSAKTATDDHEEESDRRPRTDDRSSTERDEQWGTRSDESDRDDRWQ